MAVWVARVFLGAIFIVAAAAKLADRGGHRRAVAGFGVPRVVAAPAGWALVVAEIGTGLMLLVGPFARGGALAALVMVAGFSTVVVANLARGRRPDCHCFGRLSSAPIGWTTVARNGCLAAVAVFVVSGGQFGWPLSVLALVMVGLWLGPGLRRRWTTRVGAHAPGFALPDRNRHTWTLDTLLASRRPLVVVFSQAGCGACEALLPEVANWQRDIDGRVTVVVVNSGSMGDAVDPYGLRTVLVDERRAVLASYGITATPSAVLIDSDRTLVAAPARGARAIATLVGEALSLSAKPRFTRRHALGRAVGGLASVAVLPGVAAVASACGAGDKSSEPSKPDALEVDGVWLCNQTYALCTSAPCVRSATDSDIAVCDCVVLNGYSMGFKPCDERVPSGTRVVSTFSTDNVNDNFGVMSCPSGTLWANCLDMECEVDPANPAQAHCLCKTETGESKTFGGGCDTARCTTTIWSGATPNLPGTEQYRKGMEQLGQSVDFPKRCAGPPSSTTTGATAPG